MASAHARDRLAATVTGSGEPDERTEALDGLCRDSERWRASWLDPGGLLGRENSCSCSILTSKVWSLRGSPADQSADPRLINPAKLLVLITLLRGRGPSDQK